MSVIVVLTAGSGFLASFALLHLGLPGMGGRYLAAVGAAYLVFLALLWVWLRFRNEDFDIPDPGVDIPTPSTDSASSCADRLDAGGGQFGGGGASGAFSGETTNLELEPSSVLSEAGASVVRHAGDIVDADEAAIPLALVIGIVVLAAVAVGSAFWIVIDAPLLFAELLLDGVLAGGLYRRLRKLDHRHWLEGALRRTAVPFLITAVTAGAVGWGLQQYAPDANTLGAVIAKARTG